jgi:hypothetical protein
MSFSRKIFATSHSEKQRLPEQPQICGAKVCGSGWLEETLNKNN